MLVRVALPYFSYSGRHFLPTHLQPLTFNTKHGILPRNYVLVLGDSYAAGMGGDTVYNTTRQTTTNHYLELLHQRTGHDFLNLGIEGASNPRGFLLHPVAVFEKLRDTSFIGTLDSPSIIVGLFYEGNDFIDNLEFATRHLDFQPSESSNLIGNLNQYSGTLIDKYRIQWLGGRVRPLDGVRFLLRSVWRSYVQDNQNQTENSNPPSQKTNSPTELTDNRIRFESTISVVSSNLQMPPISLSPRQTTLSTELAVQSLLLLNKKLNSQAIYLFYIPSVAVCYEFFEGAFIIPEEGPAPVRATNRFLVDKMRYHLQDKVIAREQGPPHFSLDQAIIRAANRHLVDQMRYRLRGTGIQFVDLTAVFQDVARKTAIHGPTDWQHLNPTGYNLLADQMRKFIFR